MQQLITLGFALFICLLNNVQATVLYPIDNPPENIDKNQGLLLIKLDIAGEAPSIHYSPMKTKRTTYLRKEDNFSLKKPIQIPLSGFKKGYYLIPFEAGMYQITQVDAPFYNLPYSLKLGLQAAWRFGIEAGHINYVGELVIAKERGVSHINVNLYNHFASDYQQIQQQTAPLQSQYPLMLNPGYRDDFQQALAE